MQKRLLSCVFTLVVCCLSFLQTRADNGVFYTADKLSSSMIDNITQDHYGYIWVATLYGLNRFDGYRFTHYFTDRNDSTTVQDNNITRLLVDSQHRLWIGSSTGVSRFDYERNCFVRYPFPEGLTPRVEFMMEDSEGNVLITTAGFGMFALRKGKDVITHETQFSRRKTNDFMGILFEDEQHNLWRGYQTDTITKIKVNALQPTATKNYVSKYGPVVSFLKPDSRGFLAVCMYGILRYDYATAQLSDAGYDMSSLDGEVSIRCALVDHAGNIYLGTSGRGLFLIAAGDKRIQQVKNVNGKYDITTTNVNHLFEDKDQNLWVSCYKKGLFEMNKRKDAFSTWKFANQNYVLGSGVSSVASGSDGSIWCTVQKSGIYNFDRNGKITPALHSPAGANCIYRDKQGHYWVGSENVLYSYDPNTGASTSKLKVDGWGINLMTDDGDGILYICNYGKGLCVYNTATGETRQYSMYNDAKQKGVLCNDWIKALLLDSHGLLWIATVDGVSVMNPADGNFKVFGWDVQLKGIQCFALCEHEGNILIGTDNGLYQYQRKQNKVVLAPDSKEIENKPVYSIVASRNGDLWFSSANGIWQYDHQEKRFILHNSGNGLETREFTLGALVHADDDRICYGSNEGLVAFYPDEVIGNREKLTGEVYLTNFTIDGKPVGCFADEFVIPYDQNSFAMEFSMLTFRDADNITYEYRVNGSQWRPMENGSNGISFSRMKPGKYIIEVRAASNGIYTDSIKKVTVVVKAPWYATTWAYLLYALAAIALAAFAFYYRERKRKADLDEEKMRFLINATHDIRSPLTLIMGPLNKLKSRVTDAESRADIETIDRNASRLMLLVNQILDERKIDKNQMHLHCTETDLVGFIQGICSLFHFNAQQRNIHFPFEHDDERLMVWVDRIQFDKVVSNLLSNAFKYTFDGGEVKVMLSHNDKEATLRVVDSGIGFKDEKTERLFERFYQGNNASDFHIEGTGIGLNLSRSIVLMHGGQIKAYNRTDGQRGACLEVTIPMGKAHLKPEEIAKNAAERRLGGKRQASRNLRLLVVDDDIEVVHYIQNELADWYRVEAASNGREALKMLLTNNEYDLVICDVMMPEMDGLTFLKQLKSNTNISDIPVILLTSKAEVSDRMEGLRKGADAYLAKPFNMEELHILIDNLVDNVRRLRGKFTGAQKQEDKVENVVVKGNNDVLMERIMKSINENLSDPDFNVDKLTDEVGLSRTQLHRKMKEMTGISTGEFIRNLRLEQAVRLIREGKINISQVAYSVGFNNQTYFSTVFKRYYGMTPTEFADKEKKQ
ncbi:MAG: response regulator [Prevotella sp.]|nr:response regulator [Prevotella sp.]